MPTKVKILWVFCNIIIVLGFIELSYSREMGRAREYEETQEKVALERAQEGAVISKMKKEQPAPPPADPLKVIKDLNAQGKYEEAAKLAQSLSEKNPKNSALYSWWGISLVKSGLRSAAIEKFVRSTQLDPTNSQAFLYWGLTLAMDGHYQDALEKYKTVIQLTPENGNAFTYMAASLDQLARYKEAVESANQALEINPSNSAAFEVLIEALRHSEDYQGAWEIVDRAREANVDISKKIVDELAEALPRTIKTPENNADN
ncbi:MAG: tetratricopeptide repeat protein [Nitrospinae bacterium]|nr:tetratricopeptide repeat protein [Nitrospinota bacterium]MDA1108559.1 tetratricopeptide repeat protein [Nitrospinota bacterium]